MNQLARAIKEASISHLHQFDKSGQPYILHCLHVMNTVKSKEPEVLQAAVMHDMMEDCGVTVQNLTDMGFSGRVINALKCLTHLPNESYDDYIDRVATNQDAILIKIADLQHNSDITRLKGVSKKDLERMAKYHRAYMKLTEILNNWEWL